MSLTTQDRQDIAAILATREGGRFFARFFDLAGVFRISYAHGDTHATAFKEGARNLGLLILDDVIAENGWTPLQAGIQERERLRNENEV